MSLRTQDENGRETLIVNEYYCNVRATQLPLLEAETYFFTLDILTGFTDNEDEDVDFQELMEDQSKGTVIEIQSQNYYNSGEDALMEAYGMVDFLGFIPPDGKLQMSIEKIENDQYYSIPVIFDGKDMYYSKKEINKND